jgi:hypothetical protein
MKTEPHWIELKEDNVDTSYLGFDAVVRKRTHDSVFFVSVRHVESRKLVHYAEADTLEEAKQKATDAMHTLAGVSEQRQLDDALRVILSTALISLAVTLIITLIIGALNG